MTASSVEPVLVKSCDVRDSLFGMATEGSGRVSRAGLAWGTGAAGFEAGESEAFRRFLAYSLNENRFMMIQGIKGAGRRSIKIISLERLIIRGNQKDYLLHPQTPIPWIVQMTPNFPLRRNTRYTGLSTMMVRLSSHRHAFERNLQVL